MKTTIKNSVIYVLISILLTSCTPPTTPAAHKNLNVLNRLCGNSCWNGIVVGTTTKEELLLRLKNMPDVDQTSIDEGRVLGFFEERIFFSYYVDINNKKDNVSVAAYLVNQKVAALDLYENLGVSLQDVVTAFGDPSIVSTDKDHSGNIIINFISDKGLYYGCRVDDESAILSPDLEVRALEFFDVNLYQELLTNEWFMPGYNSGRAKIYKWSGYQKIEGNYWPAK